MSSGAHITLATAPATAPDIKPWIGLFSFELMIQHMTNNLTNERVSFALFCFEIVYWWWEIVNWYHHPRTLFIHTHIIQHVHSCTIPLCRRKEWVCEHVHNANKDVKIEEVCNGPHSLFQGLIFKLTVDSRFIAVRWVEGVFCSFFGCLIILRFCIIICCVTLSNTLSYNHSLCCVFILLFTFWFQVFSIIL